MNEVELFNFLSLTCLFSRENFLLWGFFPVNQHRPVLFLEIFCFIFFLILCSCLSQTSRVNTKQINKTINVLVIVCFFRKFLLFFLEKVSTFYQNSKPRMEARKGAAEQKGSNDVVVQISISAASGSSPNALKDANFELTELNKPPKFPTSQFQVPVSRRSSTSRSTFSKPKSRLVEAPPPSDAKLAEEKNSWLKSETSSSLSSSPDYVNVTSSPSNSKVEVNAPKDHQESAPVTPKRPVNSTPPGKQEDDDEDDEEVYKIANLKAKQAASKKPKVKATLLIEWVFFVCIIGFSIVSLTVHDLEKKLVWGLELWKWCVLVLVIFCGRLVAEWFINVLVFLIERNFLLKTKVLYFVYGLKNSVQVFTWIGLILLAWGLLINRGVKRSRGTTKALNYVTRALCSCLIGAAIWLLKTLLIKLLASSFQCNRFFDRIQESIFHQYVLRVLSGPPLMERAERVGKTASTGQLSFRNVKKEKGEKKGEGKEEVIDVDRLKKMKPGKVSYWTLKGLVDVIRGTGLSTISNVLKDEEDEGGQQNNEEITCEWEAKVAANQIFHNVAKPFNKYIDEEDLLRFLSREEVDLVLPMFEGAEESHKINKKTLKTWLVNVYLERKSLAYSLNDTKTAIEELNKLASMSVVVVSVIVGLLVMGVLTTQVLVVIGSQLLLAVFMFGDTAKTLFEAIVFVFVMHPFDVGDRCVIDGVQMVVEEMNILTTIFLRFDNEKIFYPNSVLATKPISNFYRSPEMGDSVEFAVDFSTSIETIAAFKAKVKAYLESKPQYWRPGHSVLVKDIENVNKISIGLHVMHTINFQNYGDKNNRRSELVLELKKILEELGIKYHLPPQEVHVSYVSSNTSAVPPRR